MTILYGKNYTGKKLGRQYEEPEGQVAGASKSVGTVNPYGKIGELGGLNESSTVEDVAKASDTASRLYRKSAGTKGGIPTTFSGATDKARGMEAVLGKTPTSSGAYYGSAGTNVLGTDIAGNSLLGTFGGKNVIGGRSLIDRTLAVPKDPFQAYMEALSPEALLNRAQNTRDQFASERQSQLDAIRDKYTRQIEEEQEMGAEDLARQRSINLRAGLAGSDFGAAAKSQVRQNTRKNVTALEANRDIEIGNTLNQIEQLAQARVTQDQNVLQQGFQNITQIQQLQQQQQTQARDLVKQLGESGLDMETIKNKDPDLYDQIVTSSGLGEVQAEALMNNARTQAEKIDYTWKVVGNKVLGYGIDPRTGTIKQVSQDLDVEIPPEYSPSFAPDGTLMFIPDNFDPTKPFNEQVIIGGNYAKPETASSGSGLTLYQTFQATQNLKKNTQTMTAASRELQRQVGNMETAWNRLENGEAQDLNATSQAIITTFNKILDPTSVVRESEYDRTPSGQALVSQIEGKINAITQGGPGLTKESLKELVDLGKAFAEGAQANIDAKTASAREEAQFFGLNPDFVVGTAGSQPTQSSSEIEVRAPDGTIGTIPANQMKEALLEGYTLIAK